MPLIPAMYANLKRPPRSVTEWLADAVRAAAIVIVIVSLFVLPFTDFAVLSMSLPAVMLSRMIGLRSGLDLVTCVTVFVAAGSNVLDLYRAWTGWDLVVHLACTGVLAAVALVLLDDTGVIAPTGRRRTPIVVATIAGLALSAVWEMVEWFGYRFITDAIFVTYDDTIGDMIAGGAGALIAGVLASRWRLTRADRAAL
ncbi:hypothetical protein SAMN04487848_1746 [Microbacterium sp. ru370.1]|uniref:hypothetical protein n=1 Tax=unclassified Microbacterium TaxID=2609290 RepID=UPI0008915A98|nr:MULTISPECIES: hypothetical protein [unclassified Microbacterium]SDO62110.1 hypothetical protein SAMN04487848_1746 [Microbacterium sp. ru370.1]SIT86543.1 hypothetical protein SAMN05880579_1744 [Microbacterium sp. RU1D]